MEREIYESEYFSCHFRAFFPAVAYFTNLHGVSFCNAGYPGYLICTLLRQFPAWIFFFGIAFSVLYKFMPNTRVRIGSAVASGIFGGALWTIWQWFYITLQIGIANYNKIYATFASVFIFLLWVYVSWQIVLLGAEIGFAIQNHSIRSRE